MEADFEIGGLRAGVDWFLLLGEGCRGREGGDGGTRGGGNLDGGKGNMFRQFESSCYGFG